MRKLVFIIMLFVCSFANAQKNTDAIQAFFNNYANNQGFTSVMITSKAFELMAKLDINDPDYQAAKK